jgi:SAM-dependent methyltransferase
MAVDISPEGLRRARTHAKRSGARVRWLVGDLASPCKLGRVNVWHDRAVFHFMVRDEDRANYLENVRRALVPGGIAIVATFAPEGPTTCSGLPVRRYSGPELGRMFGRSFRRLEFRRERHRTPWMSVQPFSYAVFRRTAPEPRARRGGARS